MGKKIRWSSPTGNRTPARPTYAVSVGILGLSETDSVIAAGKLTAPQLAEHLNKTTFLITLDEARNTIGDPNIVEMLKSSTTNTRIKDRIRPEQGYRMQSLYAYATVVLTTNFMVQLHAGMQDRLISSEWLSDAKRDLEEVERFEEVVNQNKEDLSYIGAALKAMFLERWETIKPLLFKPDQIDIGMEIMKRTYLDLQTQNIRFTRLLITPRSADVWIYAQNSKTSD